MLIDHELYALGWLSFAVFHSILARSWATARLEAWFGHAQRLVYNLIAFVHLGVVLALGFWLLDKSFYAWPGWLHLLLGAIALAGVGIIASSVRAHDAATFFGIRQLMQQGSELPARLQTDGMYAWVRHPIYFGTLLLFWGLAQMPLGVATACWGTLYLVIGSLFEERDLVARYGDSYRDYQRRVPMLIPMGGMQKSECK
ncbi:MAG: isoprenylcysteine carboxylmethyltransferase family protein [Gemmataceae bacterium]